MRRLIENRKIWKERKNRIHRDYIHLINSCSWIKSMRRESGIECREGQWLRQGKVTSEEDEDGILREEVMDFKECDLERVCTSVRSAQPFTGDLNQMIGCLHTLVWNLDWPRGRGWLGKRNEWGWSYGALRGNSQIALVDETETFLAVLFHGPFSGWGGRHSVPSDTFSFSYCVSPQIDILLPPDDNEPKAMHFFFKNFYFIYLFSFGCTGSSLVCRSFSLVIASGDSSLVVVCELLIAVASLAVEHRL